MTMIAAEIQNNRQKPDLVGPALNPQSPAINHSCQSLE